MKTGNEKGKELKEKEIKEIQRRKNYGPDRKEKKKRQHQQSGSQRKPKAKKQ
jgi:hypothetical protein